MDDIERSKLASWLKRNMANPRVALYVDAAERRIMELRDLTYHIDPTKIVRPPPPPVKGLDRKTYMRRYMRSYREEQRKKREAAGQAGADGNQEKSGGKRD